MIVVLCPLMTSNTGYISTAYQRIKKNCCKDWETDHKQFENWYNTQLDKQENNCFYCRLPGNTTDHCGHTFRKGRRGINLEVDRIKSKEPYSPENCVLACYPCNNAKSDVFSHEEFVYIGKTIRKVKTGGGAANLKNKLKCFR